MPKLGVCKNTSDTGRLIDFTSIFTPYNRRVHYHGLLVVHHHIDITYQQYNSFVDFLGKIPARITVLIPPSQLSCSRVTRSLVSVNPLAMTKWACSRNSLQ